MQRYLRLLRDNPEFGKLWLAVVVSLTGDWFSTVVLAGIVMQYSNGSGVAISFFLALRSIPPLLLTPIAGVILDRFNRQHILIVSNLVRACIVPLYLFANGSEDLWIVYLITVIHFSLATVSEPGQAAILPALLRPQDIIEGNTLFSVTWSVMAAAGSFAGGLFAYFLGTQAAILADAGTFAVAGLLIWWIRYDPDEARRHKEAMGLETIHERDTSFREGLRYIARTPQIAAALFVKFGQSFGNFDTLMTIFGAQLFVIGATGELSLGILFFALGLGAMVGPMVSNRFSDGTTRQMRRLISAAFIMLLLAWPLMVWASTQGIVLFANADSTTSTSSVMAWLGSLGIVALAVFVRGTGASINWTYSNVIIQKTAPDGKLGRMFSIDMLGFYIASIVSTLVHGWLIDTLGIERLHWIIWGTMAVSAIPVLIWFWTIPKLEKMEAENPQLVTMTGD